MFLAWDSVSEGIAVSWVRLKKEDMEEDSCCWKRKQQQVMLRQKNCNAGNGTWIGRGGRACEVLLDVATELHPALPWQVLQFATGSTRLPLNLSGWQHGSSRSVPASHLSAVTRYLSAVKIPASIPRLASRTGLTRRSSWRHLLFHPARRPCCPPRRCTPSPSRTLSSEEQTTWAAHWGPAPSLAARMSSRVDMWRMASRNAYGNLPCTHSPAPVT